MLKRALRVMIFVDYENFRITADKLGRQANLIALRDYLSNPAEGRDLIEMVVYMGSPPAMPENAIPERLKTPWKDARQDTIDRATFLEYNGILAILHDGKRDDQKSSGYDADVDIVMAAGIIEFAEKARPDVVVLVTGDGDFSRTARTLRGQGIRVEAATINERGQLNRAVNSVINLNDFFKS